MSTNMWYRRNHWRPRSSELSLVAWASSSSRGILPRSRHHAPLSLIFLFVASPSCTKPGSARRAPLSASTSSSYATLQWFKRWSIRAISAVSFSAADLRIVRSMKEGLTLGGGWSAGRLVVVILDASSVGGLGVAAWPWGGLSWCEPPWVSFVPEGVVSSCSVDSCACCWPSLSSSVVLWASLEPSLNIRCLHEDLSGAGLAPSPPTSFRAGSSRGEAGEAWAENMRQCQPIFKISVASSVASALLHLLEKGLFSSSALSFCESFAGEAASV